MADAGQEIALGPAGGLGHQRGLTQLVRTLGNAAFQLLVGLQHGLLGPFLILDVGCGAKPAQEVAGRAVAVADR